MKDMSNRIDLHTHSTASDGTDNPLQLARKVKASGINVFSITDHDTVAGVEELMSSLPDDVVLIPGIEFSCRMTSGKCHILGYGCDTTHPSFQDVLTRSATLREHKLNLRLDFLESRGIRFPDEELNKLRCLNSVGKPHLGNLMVRYGYAENKQDAIQNTINLCYTGSSRIAAEIAVNAILASGGIPVWTHPLGGEGEKEVKSDQFELMLNELLSYGLMGLECFYSKYSMIYCSKLCETAQTHKLLVSGGSDYHGTNKSVAPGTLNADKQQIPTEQITVLTALLK